MDFVEQLKHLKTEISSDAQLKAKLFIHIIEQTSLPLDTTRILKLLLLIEPNIEKWSVFDHSTERNTNFLTYALKSSTNSPLVDFFIRNSDIIDVSLPSNEFIYTGNLEPYINLRKFGGNTSKAQYQSDFYAILHELLKSTLLDRYNGEIRVCTSGENEQLSIGNPLGTSKRKFVSFDEFPRGEDPPPNIRIKQVAIGPSSTIFLPNSQPRCTSNFFFVSGKFGTEHYITPHCIKIEEQLLNACVGMSHIVLCSRKSIYVIGDNSKNQIGFDQTTSFVKQLKRLNLADQISDADNYIIDCKTSSYHTVIFTKAGFLVAGTDVGQMGKYASRTFSQRFLPSKSFTRLLAPDDSFNKSDHVGVSVADDATAVYVGCRVKLFFEYRENRFNINPNDGVRRIIGLSICKPCLSSRTCVLIFTSTAELFLWTKGSGSLLTNPIWSMSESIPAAMGMNEFDLAGFATTPSTVPHKISLFSSSQNGEFLFVYNYIVYSGQLQFEKGKFDCHVERMENSPGYVEQIFTSSAGKNTAFLVRRYIFKSESEEKGMQLRKRIVLLNSTQQISRPSRDYVQLISKTSAFYVHLFILKIRAPSLLSLIDDAKQIKLSVSDFILRELIEFIYLGTCNTFQILKNEYTEHMARCMLNEVCDLCKSHRPWTSFETENVLPCQQPPDAENQIEFNTELFEIVETRLNKLVLLASGIGYEHLLTTARQFLDKLQNQSNIQISEGSFFPTKTNFGEVFSEYDDLVNIICDDGSIKFSSQFFAGLPYFEALQRWHSLEETRDIRLAFTSVETATIFLKFLISKSIDEALTIDDIVRLLVFADRYEILELERSVLDILESEIHLDSILEIIQLSTMLYNARLELLIVNFLVDHFPLVLDSEILLDAIPPRILARLNDLLFERFGQDVKACRNSSLISSTQSIEDIIERFLPVAISYLNSIDDSMDLMEFLRFIKKQFCRNRNKSNSMSSHQHKSSSSSSILAEGPMNLSTAPNPLQNSINESETKEQVSISQRKQVEQEILSDVNNDTCSSSKSFGKDYAWAQAFGSPSPQSPQSVTSLNSILMEEEKMKMAAKEKHANKYAKKFTSKNKVPLSTEKISPSKQHLKWGNSGPQVQHQSLANIQADEQAALTAPKPMKHVHLIEIEEKAMLELEQYYLSLFEEGEISIRVVREDQNTIEQPLPAWRRH